MYDIESAREMKRKLETENIVSVKISHRCKNSLLEIKLLETLWTLASFWRSNSWKHFGLEHSYPLNKQHK